MVLQNQIYFPNVDKFISGLLLIKLEGIMKVEVSNISISITEDGPKCASEKELVVLQYIGVYIVHKMHNNYINYKNWRDVELQQSSSFTRACIITKPCENQRLKKCHVKRRPAIY